MQQDVARMSYYTSGRSQGDGPMDLEFGHGFSGRREPIPRSQPAADRPDARGRKSGASGRPARLPPPVAYSQAATLGWSPPNGSTVEAPPGDPSPETSSPKNSRLMDVNSFHSSGTSSS